jgi:putative ABC transport system permease protein
MRAVRGLVVYQFFVAWRGWVAFALLAGLAAGVVLAAVAGARRTDSAYPRFLAASKAADALVSPAGSGSVGYYNALSRLPEVSAVAPVVGLQALPAGPDGRPESGATVFAPADGRFARVLEIPALLAGRLPLPDRPGEVAVSQIGAQALHLHVGSRLAMAAFPANAPPTGPHFRRLNERVVGVIVTRGSVIPVTELDKAPLIMASTALLHVLGVSYVGFEGAYVKLRPGAAAAVLSHQARSLAREFPATGRQVFVADESTQVGAIERAIRPEAITLALFALVVAITALLVVGQVASRLLFAASVDHPALAALGMTRRQLAAAGLVKVGVAAGAGTVLAAGVAVAASPLMPIGPARLAEPSPGVSADVPVLLIGSAATVALLLARAALPAWRLASAGYRGQGQAAGARGRGSALTQWLASAGAPITATTGVRLALEPGHGRTVVPVRGAIAGTALSIAAVAAAFTFGANLLHLVGTPRLYGKTWDVAIDLQFGSVTPQAAARLLHRVPGVSGWSFGSHGTITLGGALVPAIGIASGQGPVADPVLLDGRPPRSAHEIVLGTSVLRRAGRQVGQSVPVTINGHRQVARIVGRAVFPDFGQGSFTPTSLGEGAEMVASVFAQPGQAPYNFMLLRFSPGPRRAADITSFERSMTAYCANAGLPACVVRDQRPNGVTNYARIDGTPQVLAAVLAVLGLAVLGQFAVLAGRRRRRDFAILKALGLSRRQVSSITAWQITTLTGIALAAGLPLGVAAGRWTWALFAYGLGISADAITPLKVLAVMVPAVILLANAVAFWPGRKTARLSPAGILGAE